MSAPDKPLPTLNTSYGANVCANKGGIYGEAGTLASQALARIGKDWSKSSLTREKLLSNTREFAQHVAKNYGLEWIDNLKPGHVQSYLNDLHDRGLAPATMADKMTAVRVIAAAIGKQNIVQRTNVAYGIERVRINPQTVNLDRLVEVRQAIADRADQGEKVAQMVRGPTVSGLRSD